MEERERLLIYLARTPHKTFSGILAFYITPYTGNY
jgi:hypothetical protein